MILLYFFATCCQSQGFHALIHQKSNRPSLYFTLNGLGTDNWDHKLIEKLFTKEINQVRSVVMFLLAYTQSDSFFKLHIVRF